MQKFPMLVTAATAVLLKAGAGNSTEELNRHLEKLGAENIPVDKSAGGNIRSVLDPAKDLEEQEWKLSPDSSSEWKLKKIKLWYAGPSRGWMVVPDMELTYESTTSNSEELKLRILPRAIGPEHSQEYDLKDDEYITEVRVNEGYHLLEGLEIITNKERERGITTGFADRVLTKDIANGEADGGKRIIGFKGVSVKYPPIKGNDQTISIPEDQWYIKSIQPVYLSEVVEKNLNERV